MKSQCPNEEVFSDYLEGRMPDRERSKIEEHLSSCDTCLQDLVVTRGVVRGYSGLRSNPVPPEVTQVAVSLVKNRGLPSPESVAQRLWRFLGGLRSTLSGLFRLATWGQWRFAPIRGAIKLISKDLIQRKKVFKGVETDIEIEKAGQDRAVIRVRLRENTTQGKGMIRVTLEKEGSEISSTLLDEGYVLLEDIPFGHFALSFTRDGEMLGTYHFEIKENSHGEE
ncbi:MAG: zf-HC2 domain-containing protein [Thermodesulfobacteriota bacterium]|nr:zf-HC2 domain-containing protein [Thermodesulfobacteriota bacterium]